MTTRVLMVDEDLDVQELVNDILHINFKDVLIDRAMDVSGLHTRINPLQTQYDLVLIGDDGTKGFIDIIGKECPSLLKKAVLICSEHSAALQKWRDIPSIVKPFSLDDFGEILGKICPP
jgi:hypothetical protein